MEELDDEEICGCVGSSQLKLVEMRSAQGFFYPGILPTGIQ